MKTHSELRVVNGYIVAYYSSNYQTIRISTKFRYDKNLCTKQLFFNNKAKDYELKNGEILKIKNVVDTYIAKSIKDNQTPKQKYCQEYVRSWFDKDKPLIQNPNPKKAKNLIEHYDEYLLTKQREIAVSSYKNYKTLRAALKAYQVDKNIVLTFDNINSKEFCLNFRDFLLGQGLIDITINKRFACLKTYFIYLEDNDIYNFKNQVMRFTVPKFESEIVTLGLDELKKLQNLDLKNNEKWRKVIDVFILNCFMGLRYSDLMSMKKTDFITDDTGNIFYKNFNSKTDIAVTIPILPTALTILNKYDYDIPKFHNAIFNRELKNILTFYKLFEETIVKHYKKNGLTMRSEYKRRQLISSHTSRRTFVTNAIANNVNLSNLMKASGHTKLSTVSRYMEKRTDYDDFTKLDK